VYDSEAKRCGHFQTTDSVEKGDPRAVVQVWWELLLTLPHVLQANECFIRHVETVRDICSGRQVFDFLDESSYETLPLHMQSEVEGRLIKSQIITGLLQTSESTDDVCENSGKRKMTLQMHPPKREMSEIRGDIHTSACNGVETVDNPILMISIKRVCK
jgi:hypothetical protein